MMKHQLARILELFYKKQNKREEDEHEEQGKPSDSTPTDCPRNEYADKPFSEDEKV